jgi:branched-chain amino acid transport system ATP-binding protein
VGHGHGTADAEGAATQQPAVGAGTPQPAVGAGTLQPAHLTFTFKERGVLMTTTDVTQSYAAPAEPPTDNIIETQGLNTSYGSVRVLFDVDMSVKRGECVAILGVNGAGKSTLLKAICGLVKTQSGRIFFDGKDIAKLPTEQRVMLGISQVPGGRGLLPTLTVEENLRMGAYTIRKDKAAIAQGLERVYEYFPRLYERRRQDAGTLSGGEAQMLALGRSFVTNPKVVMIDELSLGLAPLVVEKLVDIVKQRNSEGTTFVLVEQHANLALGITDRAYWLEKGQVRFEGPSKELLERTDLLRSVFLAASHPDE